ncbi:MAG: response regulator transcription factor [Betaproteobacteria bacterium]|nr:MAG: response regulator transcription factor [Betaproteobacteria bacterium]
MHAKPVPTAVVVDDERLMREQIAGRLKEAWPELQIVGEAGNGREAIIMVHSLEPDIVFLDINMPEMDGIKAAQALAGKAHLVFVTAYDQYAIDAFNHGAIDYLLKPVEAERVALTCRRLRERLQAKPDPMNDLLEQLSQRLGSFFRAEDKYTRVQTETFEALIRKPIKELIDELDPNEFWQIHRATVVRVDAVAQVSRNFRGKQIVHLKGSDQKLEVSRTFSHLFKQM